MKRAVVLVLLAGLVALGVRITGEDPEMAGAAVPRFRQVAPGLYRGGQPTPAGFQFLKWRGIKTVINLRGENDEKGLVEQLGMKYVSLPISPGKRVSDEAIQAFLAVIRNPQNRPVFVHCRRGADRTGAMIGFYRIVDEGWSGRAAYREARALGMRWWYWGLKYQLYAFTPPRPAGDTPERK